VLPNKTLFTIFITKMGFTSWKYIGLVAGARSQSPSASPSCAIKLLLSASLVVPWCNWGEAKRFLWMSSEGCEFTKLVVLPLATVAAWGESKSMPPPEFGPSLPLPI